MGNQDSGKDAKGKEKASSDKRPDAPDLGGSQHGDSSSAFSRIAQSATALPSALFGGGVGPNEIPRLDANEKGSSSQSGHCLTRPGESSALGRPGLTSSEAIRPRQTQEHAAQEEASFASFLDSTDIEQTSAFDVPRIPQESVIPISARVGSEMAQLLVAEQEARDGEEVIALLSTNNKLPDYGLDGSVSERDMWNLRKALFGEGSDESISPVAWDNVLNFIPSYLRGDVAGPPNATANEVSMYLGPVNSDEARQAWLDQWSRVLTGYQDEVWGDLGSLIEEARDEVKRLEDVRPGGKPPQPTAILRLRAILGHLRGTVQS